MSQAPKGSNVMVIILVIAVCSLIAIGVGFLGTYKLVNEITTSIPATANAQKSAAERAQRSTTETQAVRATSTANASRAKATLQAEAVMASTAMARSQWSVVFFDPFDTYTRGSWPSVNETDSYATVNYSLDYGRYHLDIRAHKNVNWQIWSGIDELSDFHLKVDAQRIRGFTSDTYGVLFRADHGDFYGFFINDIKEYWFILMKNGSWQGMMLTARTDAIRPGEVNTIEIVAERNHFEFFINEQLVYEAEDNTLEKGGFGLSLEVFANHEAVFEFDNFTLSIPPD